MYMFREDVNLKINQTEASEVIGVTQSWLSNVLNRKVACRKVVAYSITKYISQDCEIEDFFERIK